MLLSHQLSAESGIPLPTVILVAVIVAFIVAAIACVVIIMRYKMKIKPTNYPLDKYAKLDLKESNDIFVGSYVVHRHIDNGNNGKKN